MQIIDADDESTWLDTWLLRLEADREIITAYQRERARIDAAAEENVTLRIDRPVNEHQIGWDAALAVARRTAASHRLLGFHATRLVENEIREIKEQGLQVLSPELLRRRLEALQRDGAITDRQACRLLGYNQAADDNRSGTTAFFVTRAQLAHAGLDRPCRSWGGEALYNYHEDDPETGPLLRRASTSACSDLTSWKSIAS